MERATRAKEGKTHGRCIAAVVVLLLALPAHASAANYAVNSTADQADATLGNGVCAAASGLCTLRAAVQEANESPGDDTIDLPAGDYVLTIAGSDDTAAAGDLDAGLPIAGGSGGDQDLTVSGAGARTTRIVAAPGERVFDIIPSDFALGLTISGVTITGGSAEDVGGGIRARSFTGDLVLSDVTVAGNVARGVQQTGWGGGIFASGPVSLQRVTISGNRSVQLAQVGPARGGGLYVGGPNVSLTNVTVQGNVAEGAGEGGGVYSADASVTISNSTIAGNQAQFAGTGAAGGLSAAGGSVALTNALLAENSAGSATSNCLLQGTGVTPIRSLESATDCGFTAAGNLQNAGPLLGPLQDNGGPTDTRALLAGSPAIDAGDPLACPPTDQRGIARPLGLGCDIGAFEFAPAGGAPPPPPAEPKHLADLPVPKLGKQVNVEAIKGTVLVAIPAGGSAGGRGARASQKGLTFVPLTEARQIPVGSYLDTKRGTVELVSATGARVKTQSGKFSSGIFQVLQSRAKRLKGLTTLRLKGGSFSRCRSRRGKRASASALSKTTIRKLKGNAKGRYRTRGNHSAATVRGTIWMTADRCDGTLTKVTRGKVAVRDFRRKRTVLVRAGKSYLARARG